MDFDSYLNILAETHPENGDRFKGAAGEWEVAVDLYWNRARWLDPSVGRFISEDPIGFIARDMNLMRYGRNSPLTTADPTVAARKQPCTRHLRFPTPKMYFLFPLCARRSRFVLIRLNPQRAML